ncbi:hypothetical protein Amsp01_089580 [Amycolatopsis sp. NBRC 101858]|uniref:STAS domain-containing protein n=1 Tax=Amycolatopsis sp. NBRC 101858 TaxID=3032200 RepID=UPI0024A347A3|nr:STAS domain-containing protein [Amycolatopsis sp. NBRC 101858]GLY42935.1 hypothetical protein Amsp01_089580 [Amycolatopsis sp. NBRC 101858]
MSTDGDRIRPQELLRVTSLDPGDDTDAVLVDVAGELDLLTAPLLEDALTAALANGPSMLVIDLTAITFLPSVGITLLLTARRQAGNATQFRVVAPRAQRRRPHLAADRGARALERRPGPRRRVRPVMTRSARSDPCSRPRRGPVFAVRRHRARRPAA